MLDSVLCIALSITSQWLGMQWNAMDSASNSQIRGFEFGFVSTLASCSEQTLTIMSLIRVNGTTSMPGKALEYLSTIIYDDLSEIHLRLDYHYNLCMLTRASAMPL